ncbi:hypothetical protein [Thermopirellula anaerolimosa]
MFRTTQGALDQADPCERIPLLRTKSPLVRRLGRKIVKNRSIAGKTARFPHILREGPFQALPNFNPSREMGTTQRAPTFISVVDIAAAIHYHKQRIIRRSAWRPSRPGDFVERHPAGIRSARHGVKY